MNTQLGLGCHSVRFTSTVSVSDTGDLQATVSRCVDGRNRGEGVSLSDTWDNTLYRIQVGRRKERGEVVSVSDTWDLHSTISSWVH